MKVDISKNSIRNHPKVFSSKKKKFKVKKKKKEKKKNSPRHWKNKKKKKKKQKKKKNRKPASLEKGKVKKTKKARNVKRGGAVLFKYFSYFLLQFSLQFGEIVFWRGRGAEKTCWPHHFSLPLPFTPNTLPLIFSHILHSFFFLSSRKCTQPNIP